MSDAGYRVTVVHAGIQGVSRLPGVREIGMSAPARPSQAATGGLRRVLKSRPFAPLRQAVGFAWFLAVCHLLNPRRFAAVVPDDPDLICLHEYRLLPVARRLARRQGSPILYDAHDFYPLVHADQDLSTFWRRVALPVLGRMERRAVAAAAAAVTVSESIADLFAAQYGVRPAVLRNSHCTRLEQPPPVGLRARLGLSADAFVVAVIGNRKPSQSVDSLIAALDVLPADVHVVLIGRGYADDVDLARARGVAGRVHDLGAVPAEQVVPHLREADLSAIVYRPTTENVRRCLPNGFFQSCAAGLPLLYPDLPEIAALARGGDLGLCVDPGNPSQMAEAILRLKDSPALCRQFRDHQAAAAPALAWERDEALFLALVRRLLRDRTA